jgi:hypothetical protein
MKRLLGKLGRTIGIHFAPDNHLVPILRLGRFHRLEGPGFFPIIPLIEEALPPVSFGVQVGNFIFEEVLSQDNIPFTVQMTVLFKFDPREAIPQIAAQLVRVEPYVLQSIVRDYVNQGLRRIASTFRAEEMSSAGARHAIEQNLARYIKGQLKILGLLPIDDGLLVKEMMAPNKFNQSMVNVKGLGATMRELGRYRDVTLMELGTRAAFLNALGDREGDLTFMPPLAMVSGDDQSFNQPNGKTRVPRFNGN